MFNPLGILQPTFMILLQLYGHIDCIFNCFYTKGIFTARFPSLFKGWSMFSVGASKLAAKATESALKFGEIASQKVVQVSETVGEKVKQLSLCFTFAFLFFGLSRNLCFYFVC